MGRCRCRSYECLNSSGRYASSTRRRCYMYPRTWLQEGLLILAYSFVFIFVAAPGAARTAVAAPAAAAAAVSVHPDPYVRQHRQNTRIRRRLRNFYLDSTTIGPEIFYMRKSNKNKNKASLAPLSSPSPAVSSGGSSSSSRRHPGTKFMWKFPTKESANEMFASIRPSNPIRFNHNNVGMTRPTCLSPTGNSNNDIPITTTTAAKTTCIEEHHEATTGDYSLDKYCWPDSSSTEMGFQSDDEARAKGWRVLRYRKCVGYGRECYDAVKRAVLNWEFATTTTDTNGMNENKNTGNRRWERPKEMGIIRVRNAFRPALRPANIGDKAERCIAIRQKQSRGSNGLLDVGDIRYASSQTLSSSSPSPDIAEDSPSKSRGQEIYLGAGGKRMVTYTEARYGIGFGRFRFALPSFYAVSPVCGVYDLVDERSNNGDVYTSTAYATVGRHLLSGEERVTAILRESPSHLHGHHTGKQPVHLEILSYSRHPPSLIGRMIWPFIGRMQSKFFEAEMAHLAKVGKEASVP